jgi:hypothetical protein
MKVATGIVLACPPILIILAGLLWLAPCGQAQKGTDAFWRVEEVRAGMKGEGRTVIKGTHIESFQAEVLGVMKNTSPGRDLILCRLSGCNLEKTGVIAGMSGSPVYIDGKLLGAVAYAWQFGKEPIAGITPFCQMRSCAAAYEKDNLAGKKKPRQIGLHRPISAGGRTFETVTVADTFDVSQTATTEGIWLTPLRTPLAATGFTPGSLSLLRDKLRPMGMVPLQGGGVSAAVAEREKNIPLEPGGALTVALVLGDFDLSGIGTVTHIDGKRVYGWGHPFLGVGGCEFPLMTGYVHTIYPRQSLSFKMGSPLRTVGVINADVSTCIAGWLDREPDLLPVRMTVQLGTDAPAKTFNVKVVRQKALMATLVFTALSNSVDMEGDLPEELTAEMEARIEMEKGEPIVLRDTFSGASYSGGRAPRALFGQVANVVNLLTGNDMQPVRLTRIECSTRISEGRRTADIESVELNSETFRPGDTVKARIFLKPHKGPARRVVVSLKLPDDLPEGHYSARICDELSSVRQQLRDNPTLSNPQTLERLVEGLRSQTAAKRTNLTLRVPLEPDGVALGGKALPDLPPSMVHILANSRRTGAQTLSAALVASHATAWVIQGSETVHFRVARNKRVAAPEE